MFTRIEGYNTAESSTAYRSIGQYGSYDSSNLYEESSELADMKYDSYLREIHWGIADERRVMAPVWRPITGAGIPEPQITPTNLYTTMQSIMEPMMGAMLQTMLDRMGNVAAGREATLLYGSTESGASGTTTSSAARP